MLEVNHTVYTQSGGVELIASTHHKCDDRLEYNRFSHLVHGKFGSISIFLKDSFTVVLSKKLEKRACRWINSFAMSCILA